MPKVQHFSLKLTFEYSTGLMHVVPVC